MKRILKRTLRWMLVLLCAGILMSGRAARAEHPIRVLFVGGDWKSQLPNYKGSTPLRGYFVRQQVATAAPGRFSFTLWTSYEFLQYGSAESLRQFDVIVVGDVQGESVLPRLVHAVDSFVNGGGGLMYCDNHKAFSFNTLELSFNNVLPIQVHTWRPYDTGASQPTCGENPLRIQIAAAEHPILKGLDWPNAPPLHDAHYGEVKTGADVLARSAGGTPIWVAWDHGKGRAAWFGGVFANDEMSVEFSQWPQFGQFYVQALEWLAARSTYPEPVLHPAVAEATLRVDPAQPGPALSAAHFGIHGQERAESDPTGMQGDEQAFYEDLNPDGMFARTSAGGPLEVLPPGPGGRNDPIELGTDVAHVDLDKFKFGRTDAILADIARIGAKPICLEWCPWYPPNYLDPARWTVYFAGLLEQFNGVPGSPDYHVRIPYLEIMNEPNLKPADVTLPKFADFYNYASSTLHKRFPGVKYGMGGFFEWSYIQRMIDRCGKNLDWISRHPYGYTGEAIFYMQDQYTDYARSKGIDNLQFIITEWDFWLYGEPAFDYMMERWKPVADHADTCLGTMQYRWREYQEGGYVFGLIGQFDQHYGETPPEWPNPGKNRPITYRYNAMWLMKNCRGPQTACKLESADLKTDECQRAYAIATTNGGAYNITLYYGYPYSDLAGAKRFDKLRVHIVAPIPAGVKGRQLTVMRADSKNRSVEPSTVVSGNTIDMTVEIPARSGISINLH